RCPSVCPPPTGRRSGQATRAAFTGCHELFPPPPYTFWAFCEDNMRAFSFRIALTALALIAFLAAAAARTPAPTPAPKDQSQTPPAAGGDGAAPSSVDDMEAAVL